MIGRRTIADRRGGACRRSVRLGTLVCALLFAASVAAQEEQPERPAEPVEPPQTTAPTLPNPTSRPGFFDTLGRWIGRSRDKIDEQLKNTQDTLNGIGTSAAKDAAGAARQATGMIVGLPGARVVDGRERCVAAANGAPDCAQAANALCHAKGYASGRSLDINATKKCPAWVWFSGRGPTRHDCKDETFVVRAACQ
jgi:hypothetical protein